MNSLPGYDAWATGGRYQRYPVEVFCHDRACVEFGNATQVDYESEYGAGWYTPEECPACGGEWHEDEPEREESTQ